MRIVVTLPSGQLEFKCQLHCAIDQMVSAIKLNVPDWVRIDIAILSEAA